MFIEVAEEVKICVTTNRSYSHKFSGEIFHFSSVHLFKSFVKSVFNAQFIINAFKLAQIASFASQVLEAFEFHRNAF